MGKPISNRLRYLTCDELDKLIKAARKGRYGRRDATLMLIMARHGLRVTEAVDLRWDQVDFAKGHLHVKRKCPHVCLSMWRQKHDLVTAITERMTGLSNCACREI